MLKRWEGRLLTGLLMILVGCGREVTEVDSAVSQKCGRDHPPFLTTPKEIVVEPGGATALVTEHGEGIGGRLSRVDLNSGRIWTVVSGLTEPEGLALLPDGKKALVLESFTASGADTDNRLLQIDLENCGMIVVASGFHHTEGIAAEVDDKSALAVTHAFEGTLSRINLTTGEVTPRDHRPGLSGGDRHRSRRKDGLDYPGVHRRGQPDRPGLRNDPGILRPFS